jgi:hypothetical protein
VFLIVGYYMMLQGLRRYRGIAKNVGRYGGQRLEIMPSKTMTAATVVLDVAITIVVVLFLLSAFE